MTTAHTRAKHYAKAGLRCYCRNAIQGNGGTWTQDNAQEVDHIVELIIEAAVGKALAAIKKAESVTDDAQ